MREVDHLIGGEAVASAVRFDVRVKCSGAVVARVALSDRAQVDRAVDVAAAAMRKSEIEPYRRCQILQRAAELLQTSRERIVDSMVSETGF